MERRLEQPRPREGRTRLHPGSRWRNRKEFVTGRAEIKAFLTRKWSREPDYRLIKEVWGFRENLMAVRFAYKCHDAAGQWFRSYGNALWEFDEAGLMRRRIASINDAPNRRGERKYHWPLARDRPLEPAMPRPLALAAATLALATAAVAAPSPEEMQRPAFERAETAAAAGAPEIAVSSALVKAGGAIPLEFTRYGRNLAPPVAWSGAPHATRSYAILMEDPDARPKLVTHWVIWNIPGDVGVLPRGVKNTPEPDRPKGARQGPNSHGGMGWAGPHPPPGDPPHHYHLQVFALDRTLGVGAGADKEKVLAALRGHVLAKGEVVGEFAAPAPPAPKPAAPPAQ